MPDDHGPCRIQCNEMEEYIASLTGLHKNNGAVSSAEIFFLLIYTIGLTQTVTLLRY